MDDSRPEMAQCRASSDGERANDVAGEAFAGVDKDMGARRDEKKQKSKKNHEKGGRGRRAARSRRAHSDPEDRTKLDPAELKRAAKLARSMLPRRHPLRSKSDRRVVVDGFLMLGAACGTLYGVWSEYSIRAIGLVLADITDREAGARSVRAWMKITALSTTNKNTIKKQIAKDARGDRDEDRSSLIDS